MTQIIMTQIILALFSGCVFLIIMQRRKDREIEALNKLVSHLKAEIKELLFWTEMEDHKKGKNVTD